MLDMNLGIMPQALSVLQLLRSNGCFEDEEDDLSWVRSYAWYNGRERGVVLTLQSFKGIKTLCVTFGENRNSDDIFVDVWVVDQILLNPPTVETFTDKAYEERRTFAWGCVGEAANYVTLALRSFADKESPPR